jgi:hypothetical protein
MDSLIEKLQPKNAFAVVPSDTTDLLHVAVALYVGTSGDVTVDTLGGDTVTFKNVPIGDLIGPFRRVRSTLTTASNILARYSS